MHEKTITLIAISTTITGILILFFTLPTQPDETTRTSITGAVTRIDHKEKITLISIQPTKPITIITFTPTNISTGDHITALGQLQSYRGKIELIAETLYQE